jgi:hypothetical protein
MAVSLRLLNHRERLREIPRIGIRKGLHAITSTFL